MQQIQIARGLLQKRLDTAGPLAFGELFFDTTENRRNIYIGLKEGHTRIGGENSLHYRGEWDHDYLPNENIIVGDVYKLLQDVQTEHPADPGKKDFPEYYKGDLVIAAGIEKDADGNDNIIWVKVASNGGDASNVKFNNEYTSFLVDELGNICVVQDALVYLDRNKLSYGGQLEIPVEEKPEGQSAVRTYTEEEIRNFAIATLKNSNSRITNPAGFYFAIPRDILLGKEPYYENDFVVITSSDYTNENGDPDVETYKIQRMPGGAHSADKIDVDSSKFNRELAAESEYDTDDSAINNVQGALEQLFNTKADLDRHGKIILNQIPETIIGSIDYQGIVTTKEDSDNVIVIPKLLETNNEEEFEDDKYIQKGDYWVYQGNQLKFDDTLLLDKNGNEIKLNSKATYGDDIYINNGDWFIASEDADYNIVFDILDNTAPFIGITCGDTGDANIVQGQILDGTVNFTGNTRDNKGLKEATVTKNETGNGVLISSPNAALIEDIANAALFKDYILKVNEYGVLVKGHIKDVENGIQLEGYKEQLEADETTIKQNIVVNPLASRTDPTTITLPKNSGTLVTSEEVGLAKGRDNFNVMFNFDEETQQTKFIESPMEMHKPTDGNEVDPTSAEGFIFHRDPNSKTQVLFRKDEVGKEQGNTVQIMPPLSGVLLNTNSIIDCGYWGEEGLAVYETEPNKLDKYPKQFDSLESYEEHLISLAGGTDYQQYRVTFADTLYGNSSSINVVEGKKTYFPQLNSNKLYTFVGWRDESGNEWPVDNSDAISPEITANTTFTSIWQANTVALILRDIDGTILTKSSDNTQQAIYTKPYGDAFEETIKDAIIGEDGYKVVGWTRSLNGAKDGYVEKTNEDGTKYKEPANITDTFSNDYDESEYEDIAELGLDAKVGYSIYRLRNPFVTVEVEGKEGFVFEGYVTRGLVDTTFTDKIKEFIEDTIDYGTMGKGYGFYIYYAHDGGKDEYIKIKDIFNHTFTEPTTIVARYEENDEDDEYTSVYALEADGSTIYYELIPHYTDDWKNQLFDDLGLGKLYDKDKIDLITFELDTKGEPADYLNKQSTYENPIRVRITIQEEIEAHLEDDPEPMGQ